MTDQMRARFGYHPLLASDAMTAPDDSEDCALCRRPLRQGEHVARLADGTDRWAHVHCVAGRRP